MNSLSPDMRLESDGMQIAQVTRNAYFEVESLNAHGKRLVSRTRSEPISFKAGSNFVKRIRLQNGSIHYENLNFSTTQSVSPTDQDCFADVMHKAIQSPNSDGQVHGVMTGANGNMPSFHSSKVSGAKGAFEKANHRRSFSVSERDFVKNGRISSIEESLRKRKEQASIYKTDNLMVVQERDCQDCQPAACVGASLSTSVVTTQPRPTAQPDSSNRRELPRKDTCFRCLQSLKKVIKCCTCIWCFDATCYHCFKDDVGYTSWFSEMLHCSKAPLENVKQWSLLGLATVVFPCILLYPIFGAAVNQCIDCRLEGYRRRNEVAK